MAIYKELTENEELTIEDHKKHTDWELIKCYTLKQLSYMDWLDSRTIKNSPKYLPVRVDDYQSIFYFNKWQKKRLYSVRYVKVEEVEKILSKKLGYKIVLPK